MSDDEPGCQRYVSNGRASVRKCGKKLKGDPEYPNLCGLHVAAIHRRQAKADAMDEARARRDREAEEIKTRVDMLNKALGLHAIAEWTIPQSGAEKLVTRATGRVIVDLVELEAMAAKITKFQQVASRRFGGTS